MFFRLLMKNSRYTWAAETKDNPHPYICASQCASGYMWRKEARMCVKIVTAPATFTEAEVVCAKDNGRLASVKTCSEFVGIATHLWKKDPTPTNTYWFGIYMSGLSQYSKRKTVEEKIGNTGLFTVLEGMENSCIDSPKRAVYTIDGNSPIMMLAPSPNGYHGELIFQTDGSPQIMAHEFGKQDSTLAQNFLCEKDESWTCPDGFIMFQQLCYQLNINEMTQAEAEIVCNDNGGRLLHIETRMQHTFITAAFPPTVYKHNQTWLHIQKQTNGPLDIFYSGPNGIFVFDFIDYASNPQLDVPDENCVVMDATDASVVNAFKKVSCQQTASFICENQLILDPYYIKIMPEVQVLLPLDYVSGIEDLAYPDRQNYENLVALTEDIVLESGLIGSSHFMGNALSYIDIENSGVDKEMKSSFGISISMWVNLDENAIYDNEIQMLVDSRTECGDGSEVSEGFTMFLTKTMLSETLDPFTNNIGCGLLYNNSMLEFPMKLVMPLFEIRPSVELCSKQADGTMLCTRIAASEKITQGEWVHIGFTFNDISKKGTFFVGDTFGYLDLTVAENHQVEYFTFDTNGWWSSNAVNEFIRIGSAKFQAPQGLKNFAGKISCLQIYEGPLTLAQFITLAKCPVGESYPKKAELCPADYDYYKGYCYKLSLKEEEFSTAEALCISPPGTIHL